MFVDRRVRRALTMLIDRDDIVEQPARLGLDTVAASWFYPGAREYDRASSLCRTTRTRPATCWRRSVGSITTAMACATRTGAVHLHFLYPAGPPFYEQLASLLQSDFKKAGIVVNTARVDGRSIRTPAPARVRRMLVDCGR